jgi:eukaryotic-like serine/threonine-protein kinase
VLSASAREVARAVSPMPRIGSAIGRFTLEHELGRGPMSEVFLGVERGTGWKVAVKVFLLEPGSKPADAASWAQRMVREAAEAARFRHERVIQVHEVAEQGGAPYLVRDFIEGRALVDHIHDRSAGALGRKLGWLSDLAMTLADIHRAGLVHRDVKPSNVLIRRDGALRLLDFGVARRSVDREAGLVGPTSDRLSSGSERLRVLGTPAYIAPERFAHRATSAATDQFGWGVLAYELLAGHLPWGHAVGGKRPRSVPIIEAILTQPATPLRASVPELPPALEAVVACALGKDPEARFPAMADLASALAASLR